MKCNRRLPKVRRKLHRAFFAWLVTKPACSSLSAILIKERQDDFVSFTLQGLNPALSFGLSKWELGVHVQWQGIHWDSLIFFESIPQAKSGSYVCALCEAEYQKHYPNKTALWVDHDFEPFLEWINNQLISTRWLALYGIAEGSTWASLVDQPDCDAQTNLPIWSHH